MLKTRRYAEDSKGICDESPSLNLNKILNYFFSSYACKCVYLVFMCITRFLPSSPSHAVMCGFIFSDQQPRRKMSFYAALGEISIVVLVLFCLEHVPSLYKCLVWIQAHICHLTEGLINQRHMYVSKYYDKSEICDGLKNSNLSFNAN